MVRSHLKSTLRLIPLAGACWLGFAACGGSNDPASGGGGGSTPAGTSSSSSSGGPATTSSSSGTPATTSSSSSSSSGTPATTSSSSSSSGAAGTSSSSSSTGTTSSSGGTSGSPLCSGLSTAAGAAPTKGGACVSADPPLCYKTCGPNSIGFKSETCTAGAYVEQSGCTFPTGVDYSCYKIPTTMSATCPATAPKASDPCTVAACTPCNVGGAYLDSSGASKTGYCVCPAPGVSGTSKWSCASSTAWPCPAGQGC